MIGMSRTGGTALVGEDHLHQSVADILSTPIGSRVCRRDYGSLLPELIDQGMNAAGKLRLFAATAIALARWEPRLRLTRVGVERASDAGAFVVTLEGVRTDVATGPTRLAVSLPVTPMLNGGARAANA